MQIYFCSYFSSNFCYLMANNWITAELLFHQIWIVCKKSSVKWDLTILVVVGQKFEFARKWKKIHIVSPKWLYDSADSGYTMEEHRYRVDGSSQSSGDNQQMSTSTPDKRTESGYLTREQIDGLTRWGRDRMDAISQTPFWSALI